MIDEPIVLLVISLAAYRLAHVLTGTDSLLEGWSRRVEAFAYETDSCGGLLRDACGDPAARHGSVVAKMADLLTCSFCLGYHVGLVMLCVWVARWPWELGWTGWITSLAIAGLQSFITSIDGR